MVEMKQGKRTWHSREEMNKRKENMVMITMKNGEIDNESS